MECMRSLPDRPRGSQRLLLLRWFQRRARARSPANQNAERLVWRQRLRPRLQEPVSRHPNWRPDRWRAGVRIPTDLPRQPSKNSALGNSERGWAREPESAQELRRQARVQRTRVQERAEGEQARLLEEQRIRSMRSERNTKAGEEAELELLPLDRKSVV